VIAAAHGRPVFVTHYPAACKPFYARLNDCDGGRTVRRCRGHAALLNNSFYADILRHFQVEAFDLLVPGMGEIIGGSAREERLGPLLRSLNKSPGEVVDPNAASSQLQPGWEDAVNASALKWQVSAVFKEARSKTRHSSLNLILIRYVELRRWGSVRHAGFGLGFDRLVLLLTGLNNVR
jgi:asparaginyl-tRNA synthetase